MWCIVTFRSGWYWRSLLTRLKQINKQIKHHFQDIQCPVVWTDLLSGTLLCCAVLSISYQFIFLAFFWLPRSLISPVLLIISVWIWSERHSRCLWFKPKRGRGLFFHWFGKHWAANYSVPGPKDGSNYKLLCSLSSPCVCMYVSAALIPSIKLSFPLHLKKEQIFHEQTVRHTSKIHNSSSSK